MMPLIILSTDGNTSGFTDGNAANISQDSQKKKKTFLIMQKHFKEEQSRNKLTKLKQVKNVLSVHYVHLQFVFDRNGLMFCQHVKYATLHYTPCMAQILTSLTVDSVVIQFTTQKTFTFIHYSNFSLNCKTSVCGGS